MSIALRAQITIDVHAEDFVGAAEHQRRLEELMLSIQNLYSGASLVFRGCCQSNANLSLLVG